MANWSCVCSTSLTSRFSSNTPTRFSTRILVLFDNPSNSGLKATLRCERYRRNRAPYITSWSSAPTSIAIPERSWINASVLPIGQQISIYRLVKVSISMVTESFKMSTLAFVSSTKKPYTTGYSLSLPSNFSVCVSSPKNISLYQLDPT